MKMIRSVAHFSLRAVRVASQKSYLAAPVSQPFRSFTNAVKEPSKLNGLFSQRRRDVKGNVVVKHLLDSHAKGKITEQASRVALLQQLARVGSSSPEHRQELIGEKFQVHFENLLDEIGLNIRESRRQEISVILWSLGKLRAR